MFASLKRLSVPSRRTTIPIRANRRFAVRAFSEELERRDLMAVGLDPTFGYAGTSLVTSFPSTPTVRVSENLSSVAVQTDGKLVAVGYRYTTLSLADPNANSMYLQDIALERKNADGSADPTFGVGGSAMLSIKSGDIALDSTGVDLVIQPDGKIVVLASTSPRDSASLSSTRSIYDFAVARFNSNGTVDTTFNGTGYKLIDFTPATTTGNVNDTPSGIAIAPGGKIVVAGDTSTPFTPGPNGTFVGGTRDMAVARLNPDGTLDASFGGGGKIVVAFDIGGSKSDTASAVVVQADGKVILAGSASVADVPLGTGRISSTGIAVARLNPDGSPDGTFGNAGKVVITYDLGGVERDDGADAVLDGDKIVIVGTANLTAYAYNNNTPINQIDRFTVTRLNANGSLDATFAGTGKFASGIAPGGALSVAVGTSLALLSDGSYLVAGQGSIGESVAAYGLFLANVLPSGGLNTSYGISGAALLPQSYSYGNGKLAVQPDGKIVFATYSGLVRTTAPAPKVLKAQMVAVSVKKNAPVKTIKVKFNTALNAALANKKTSYQVRLGKKGKRFLEIKKVSYDASTFETTITLKSAVPKGVVQVMLSSLGIAGADSQLLNNGEDTAVTVDAATPATTAVKRRKA